MHYTFADLAILSSENASDKKLIILSLKGVFFWGMYKKKGARSFVGITA